MGDDGKGRVGSGEIGKRANGQFTDGVLRKNRKGTCRRTRCGRVRRVGRHQQRWFFAADDVAFEVFRNGDDKIGIARLQDPVDLAAVFDGTAYVEIGGGLHRRQEAPDKGSAVMHFDDGRQVPGVGIDGEAEQHQLHDGNRDHHGEGHAVATHLDEFLHQNRQEPADRKGHVRLPSRTGSWLD